MVRKLPRGVRPSIHSQSSEIFSISSPLIFLAIFFRSTQENKAPGETLKFMAPTSLGPNKLHYDHFHRRLLPDRPDCKKTPNIWRSRMNGGFHPLTFGCQRRWYSHDLQKMLASMLILLFTAQLNWPNLL